MIRSETFVIVYDRPKWPITVQNMNTLGHVQYCVNVVSIKNLERRKHLTIKYFVWLTYFNTYTCTMNIRINSAVTAILMTSLFTLEAHLRCVNWIKSLLIPQSLI